MTDKLSKREQTHQKMLDAAGAGFRSQGFAGIGVDGIAKEAGVTSGAFYAHFGSKAAAFKAALAAGLDEVIEGIPEFQRKHGAGWVVAFTDYYLGKPHRDNLQCGCAMTTLTPEVARTDSELAQDYEARMTVIVERIAEGLAGDDKADRRARAWAMLAVLIGGLNMARAMHSPGQVEIFARTIKQAAITAAGPARE